MAGVCYGSCFCLGSLCSCDGVLDHHQLVDPWLLFVVLLLVPEQVSASVVMPEVNLCDLPVPDFQVKAIFLAPHHAISTSMLMFVLEGLIALFKYVSIRTGN